MWNSSVVAIVRRNDESWNIPVHKVIEQQSRRFKTRRDERRLNSFHIWQDGRLENWLILLAENAARKTVCPLLSTVHFPSWTANPDVRKGRIGNDKRASGPLWCAAHPTPVSEFESCSDHPVARRVSCDGLSKWYNSHIRCVLASTCEKANA